MSIITAFAVKNATQLTLVIIVLAKKLEHYYLKTLFKGRDFGKKKKFFFFALLNFGIISSSQ